MAYVLAFVHSNAIGLIRASRQLSPATKAKNVHRVPGMPGVISGERLSLPRVCVPVSLIPPGCDQFGSCSQAGKQVLPQSLSCAPFIFLAVRVWFVMAGLLDCSWCRTCISMISVISQTDSRSRRFNDELGRASSMSSSLRIFYSHW